MGVRTAAAAAQLELAAAGIGCRRRRLPCNGGGG